MNKTLFLAVSWCAFFSLHGAVPQVPAEMSALDALKMSALMKASDPAPTAVRQNPGCCAVTCCGLCCPVIASMVALGEIVWCPCYAKQWYEAGSPEAERRELGIAKNIREQHSVALVATLSGSAIAIAVCGVPMCCCMLYEVLFCDSSLRNGCRMALAEAFDGLRSNSAPVQQPAMK